MMIYQTNQKLKTWREEYETKGLLNTHEYYMSMFFSPLPRLSIGIAVFNILLTLSVTLEETDRLCAD